MTGQYQNFILGLPSSKLGSSDQNPRQEVGNLDLDQSRSKLHSGLATTYIWSNMYLYLGQIIFEFVDLCIPVVFLQNHLFPSLYMFRIVHTIARNICKDMDSK